jgi:adenylate kinase family enzyme
MRGVISRVVVIGTSCAGKTTFARSLADALSCPHVEFDALHWQPNWVPRALADFRALTAQALSQDCWVTDGNYGAVRDLVWSRATTVIWLNYAFRLVLWRALARTVRRVLTREELFSGNRESLRMAFFSRESILWWVITTFHRRRKQYRELFDKKTFAHRSYIEFRKPSEAESFLERLKTGTER